ncbi:hypothetical protein, partial [Streptomyces sioyaensis]|uniref:hypothetical protein n=1 Tax=Streptomyces sioyaensis TaxID=67364 RepID=UPI00371AB959
MTTHQVENRFVTVAFGERGEPFAERAGRGDRGACGDLPTRRTAGETVEKGWQCCSLRPQRFHIKANRHQRRIGPRPHLE